MSLLSDKSGTGDNKIEKKNTGPMKDDSETPEFFMPDLNLKLEDYIQMEDTQGIHHLGRYHWARQVIEKIPNKSIIDIACGSGFGSYMLAGNFPSSQVVGVDYDQRAVDLANNNYSLSNLKYAKGNMVTWKFEGGDWDGKPLGEFDVITSFDTLEHILHREIALKNIITHLNKGGHLIISTPCSRGETKLKPGWEHHKIEYNFDDLYDFLKRYFREIKRPEDGSLPALDFWKNIINKDKERYLTMMNPLVCSDPIIIDKRD